MRIILKGDYLYLPWNVGEVHEVFPGWNMDF